jgi:hypothetical protein
MLLTLGTDSSILIKLNDSSIVSLLKYEVNKYHKFPYLQIKLYRDRILEY